MVMLYLFKLEVFDAGLSYSYSTDCTIIADTRHDREPLIRRQFGEHNQSVVKRTVLIGARVLTCSEADLLRLALGRRDSVWLTTRVYSDTGVQRVRHLPRLQSEAEMVELLERKPEGYDSIRLMTDQYPLLQKNPGSSAVAASFPVAA